MALTFSNTGLQAQIVVVATAIDGRDFATALSELAKAHLILLGLPLESKGDDTVTKMREDVDKLAALIGSAQAANSASDRRRLIRTGLSHG